MAQRSGGWRWVAIGAVVLVAGGAGLVSCGPTRCGTGECNEARGGGVCMDKAKQVSCACNVGYQGARCEDCASGFKRLSDGSCQPTKCVTDACNESNGGGMCVMGQGSASCTCTSGYLGTNCRLCAADFHHIGAQCVADGGPSCAPRVGGSTGAVQAPTLRTTLPASWDENWFASPAVADLDGDGKPEIIAARHSVLYVWSGAGTLVWRAAWNHSSSEAVDHGSTRMWASPVVGDFDGDGKLEIAVGSDADGGGPNVAVYDARGILRPGWPVTFGNSEVRSITAGDLDGDGIFEIVVNKTSTGPATAVYQITGQLRAGWPQVNHATCDPPAPAEACWDFGGYNQNVGLADLDRDGRLDVISSYDAIGFGIFHRNGAPFPTQSSFTDRVVTAVEAYHDLALSQQGWGTGDRSEFTYSPPVFADVDGDGNLEVILAGDHEHTTSTMNRGNTLWALHHDMTRPAGWNPPKDSGGPLDNGSNLGQNIVPTRPSPSVGDLDSASTGPEIVYPSYDGLMHAYTANGVSLWTYNFGQGPLPYQGASEALIADLNGDGVPEVIFTTFSSGAPGKPDVPAHLVVLDHLGVLLHKIPLYGRGSMAAPTIADVDGDGQPELIVSLKDTLGSGMGGVQIWNLPGASTHCILWGTGRGGWLRQGRAQ